MINLFRNLTSINIFLLLGFIIFMRLALVFNMPDVLYYNFLEPFSRLLIDVPLEETMSPFVNVLIAGVMVFIQALLFNKVINNHNLLGKSTFLPGLMYVVSSSLFLYFMFITPALLCNFLIIWLIDLFLKIGKSINTITRVFDIGLIIGVGTVIYFPFISMFLLIFVALMLFRSFDWREWVAGLIGFLTIFFFLAVWYYWNNQINDFYIIWKPLINKFPSIVSVNYNDYLVMVPVAVVILLSSLILRENFFRSFINTRKAFQLLFFMFIIACLSFYLKAEYRVWHFLLAVPAMSVVLAYYFSHAKKRWFYESLFVILIVSIQYFLIV